MDDTILIKSGALNGRTSMPNLAQDELGYQTEEEALYIGTPNGNKRLCGANDIERIKTLETKIGSLEGQISTIMARLEALEAPTE